MKHLLKILLLALVVGCADSSDEATSTDEPQVVESLPSDTEGAIAPPSADAPVPANETLALGWWDSLISDDRAVRMEAMNKYKEVRAKGNGNASDSSELIPGYVKTFFSAHPDEFLIVYAGMTEAQKKTVRGDLAREFYSAGSEYKSYLDEYFTNIQNSCENCTDEQITLLKDVRQKIESDVKRKVDSDATKANS